jgi:hypothetical protein
MAICGKYPTDTNGLRIEPVPLRGAPVHNHTNSIMNNFPYDLYKLDSYSITYHALARYKQLVRDENMPTDVLHRIEDEILPALEAIITFYETLD